MKKIIKELYPYVVIVILVVLIRTYLMTPGIVNGSSMEYNLYNNDLVIVNKIALRSGIKRFDVVVIDYDNETIIKRIIGLPGETVKYRVYEGLDGKEKNELTINGEVISEDFINDEYKNKTCISDVKLCSEEGVTLKENEYFAMGDNRGVSKDSRMIGPISRDNIIGKVRLLLFPFTRFGKVK